MESTPWLELLDPFVTVKNLYLLVSGEVALRVGHALRELERGRVSEVLPLLQYVFLRKLHAQGPVQEAIGQFVGARQLSDSDHSVVVDNWEMDEHDWTLESFGERLLSASRHANLSL